jgi:hypothetical protein
MASKKLTLSGIVNIVIAAVTIDDTGIIGSSSALTPEA